MYGPETLTVSLSEESLSGVHPGSIVPQDLVDAWVIG
jgi:hypothetical protein